jgi:FtsZ-binding cell division protein ZapB
MVRHLVDYYGEDIELLRQEYEELQNDNCQLADITDLAASLIDALENENDNSSTTLEEFAQLKTALSEWGYAFDI